MTSYLTSFDNFTLSHSVFQIFEFKVLKVRPWPLEITWGWKYFHYSKAHTWLSIYTSIDNFNLSHTVFEIFDFKVSRVWPWPLVVIWGQKYSTIREPIFDFLSNFYWHFLSISNRFWDILRSPGNDAKLIRCVLGTTLNSSVVVQVMTVKLRPCLRFRACGWGCVRWNAPCKKGRGWYVELTWLALLSLYYIL